MMRPRIAPQGVPSAPLSLDILDEGRTIAVSVSSLRRTARLLSVGVVIVTAAVAIEAPVATPDSASTCRHVEKEYDSCPETDTEGGHFGKTIALSNGVQLPMMSIGTAHLFDVDESHIRLEPKRTYRSLHLALEVGYRSIDTALVYRSHEAVRQVLGEWFRLGKLSSRSDVFLTSKVFRGKSTGTVVPTARSHMPNLDDMTPQQVTEETRRHVERTLEELGVGYLDLMLLHWPATFHSQSPDNRHRRLAAWKVLEEYYRKGWLRAIGVSNFNQFHLQQLMEDGATITPMVNQIEASVYIQWTEIVNYCRNHGIVLQAYSPLGRGVTTLLADPLVAAVASKHGKSSAQVALRHLVELDYAVVVLSSSAERLASNLDIFDFALTNEDHKQLQSLNRHAQGTWGQASPYGIN